MMEIIIEDVTLMEETVVYLMCKKVFALNVNVLKKVWNKILITSPSKNRVIKSRIDILCRVKVLSLK